MDVIRIEGLELRCIVGVRSYERRREQPLRIDVRLGLDLSSAGRSGYIHDTADYAQVADEVTALLRFREYRLLEVAAEEAAAMLLASHPAVQEVGIRLDKPQALAGRARGASVEVSRTRGAYNQVPVTTPYGSRHELLSGPEATLELLRIDPGKSASWGASAEPVSAQPGEGAQSTPGAATRRLEWLVSGQLVDLPVEHSVPLIPPATTSAGSPPAVYRNQHDVPALLFRCLAPVRPPSWGVAAE